MEFLDSIGYEVFIALITGGLVAILNYGRKYVSNKKIERAYPISGEYLSVFEDEDKHGNPIRSHARVKMSQNGKNILGVSYMDGREWTLEGHISSRGWLYGTYYSKKVNDSGIGNFFLSIQPDGSLEGIWSGYGAVGKKILSGRYSFNLVYDDYSFCTISKNNYLAALQLLRSLGKDISKTFISDLIDDESTCRKGIIVYNEDKKAIACALYGIFEWSEISQLGLSCDSEAIESFQLIGALPIISHIYVDGKYRSRGLGTQILDKIISDLKSDNHEIILGIKSKDCDGISTFYENNDFSVFSDTLMFDSDGQVIVYLKNI